MFPVWRRPCRVRRKLQVRGRARHGSWRDIHQEHRPHCATCASATAGACLTRYAPRTAVLLPSSTRRPLRPPTRFFANNSAGSVRRQLSSIRRLPTLNPACQDGGALFLAGNLGSANTVDAANASFLHNSAGRVRVRSSCSSSEGPPPRQKDPRRKDPNRLSLITHSPPTTDTLRGPPARRRGLCGHIQRLFSRQWQWLTICH